MTPEEFLISNRGRLERAWAAYLYILIEAWRAKSNNEMRQFIKTKVSIDKLEQALREAERLSLIMTLRQVRHYMCHRDKREYWDRGRYIYLGNLAAMMKLHDEFGEVFMSIMRP